MPFELKNIKLYVSIACMETVNTAEQQKSDKQRRYKLDSPGLSPDFGH